MAPRRRAEMAAENREKLIAAARKAFAEKGYAAASMDELTAEAGLTRGALYHAFGDKKGLLAAVIARLDAEMVERARRLGAAEADDWNRLLTEQTAYIEMALDPEIQRIMLLDGPAALGDPSNWPGPNACLEETRGVMARLAAAGVLRPVDVEAAARLLTGAALNAALWVAASDAPEAVMPRAVDAFRSMAEGLRAPQG